MNAILKETIRKWCFERILLTVASKTIIYQGINAMKEVPDLYIKNCISLSETKEH